MSFNTKSDIQDKGNCDLSHTQDKNMFNKNWLLVGPDIGYSRNRLWSSCYKYIQKIEVNCDLKKKKDNIQITIQQIGNINWVTERNRTKGKVESWKEQ